MNPSISVVINTLNEESNLPYALRSVRPWADEIVVVDMHSDDRTVEIAEGYSARIFSHARVGYVEPARAFAIAQATGDWILVLDADEIVPPRLADRLVEVAKRDVADVVSIPWLNYLLGAPAAGMGWGPEQNYHQRFFKRGWVETSGDIHSTLTVHAGARVLRIPPENGLAMVHFSYLDAFHFLDKLNRYTSIEAEEAFARGERSSIRRALRQGGREWWRRYVRRRGYRDGWRGFYLCLFMVFYRIAVQVKLKELSALGGRVAIQAGYRREADRILAGYEGTRGDLVDDLTTSELQSPPEH